MKFVGLFLLALAPLSASTISSFSTSLGTPFTVSYDAFAANETNMANRLTIVAEFGADGNFSCTWQNAATNCSNANFSVIFTDGDTYGGGIGNHFWTITNLSSTFTLTAMNFNGVVGTGDGVAFDRCMNNGAFNDTNSGGNCATEGTPGSNNGWTAASISGGTAGITAVASYTNILKLAANPAVGDAYGVARLVFGGTNTFTQNENFTFRMDTDLVNNVQSGVPEPGSLALLGSGLLGLGILARRRRKQ